MPAPDRIFYSDELEPAELFTLFFLRAHAAFNAAVEARAADATAPDPSHCPQFLEFMTRFLFQFKHAWAGKSDPDFLRYYKPGLKKLEARGLVADLVKIQPEGIYIPRTIYLDNVVEGAVELKEG